jgi:hypothetical protein
MPAEPAAEMVSRAAVARGRPAAPGPSIDFWTRLAGVVDVDATAPMANPRNQVHEVGGAVLVAGASAVVLIVGL